MPADKFHSGVPTDRQRKIRQPLSAPAYRFRDPAIARMAAIACVLGATMFSDDLSADSVSPVGIDLVLGRRGSFTRGGNLSATALALAPTTANTITGVSTANPGVVTTSAAHGLTTGAEVGIIGVAGATQANGIWKVTVLSTTTFSIPVNVTGTYSGSGAFWVPCGPGIEVSGHGSLRLDAVETAHSGTSPSTTLSVWTSYDNGVTDTWRQCGSSMTAITTEGTSRQVFTGLDRWVMLGVQFSGSATPTQSLTVSGELV